MFPVKGWSVSAEKLKVETERKPPAAANPNGDAAAKPPRKRKRQQGVPNTVTEANLSDLWGKIIEHKKAPKLDKKAKIQGDDPKDQKEKKKQLKSDETPAQEAAAGGRATKKNKEKQVAAAAAPPAPPAAKLTPLQASMREKLISARFRHLNETLYTRPSAEAFNLFQDSPEMFSEYHEGFRRQVDVWPENPVDTYIREIKTRAKVRFPPRNARHDFSNPIDSSLLPLPRTNGTCSIADLGCGDAALAKTLDGPISQKLGLDIRSYDLQTGGNPLVTRADIANLPLPNNSVDVVIFCLALMGTNWVDFVEEAYRVLRWKGELWVAEIKSRFALPKKGGKAVVAHSVGNRRNPMPATPAAAPSKKTKEIKAAEKAEAEEAELAVEVDGAELRKQETDVSSFVDVLRARGFVLHKELGMGAVDLSNKMFVRMHFVKAMPATKGKCVVKEEKKNSRDLGPQGPFNKTTKFLPELEEEEGANINEAAVLKPCVYKLR
ncbi:methyltransferase-domain-containing protein [Bombardia bombarda]|uniref:Ribosomal RNA-processing protein 8 n=1 Tax=Bombardia bombarda TaxID=252184 RepID=A0AA39X9H0_9PEZI|nr:methyltransferase-domain-containing protein [Bombardia bombarda]